MITQSTWLEAPTGAVIVAPGQPGVWMISTSPELQYAGQPEEISCWRTVRQLDASGVTLQTQRWSASPDAPVLVIELAPATRRYAEAHQLALAIETFMRAGFKIEEMRQL